MGIKEECAAALKQIDAKLLKNGFVKQKSEKGWYIYTLGDNYFNVTKRFARLEIRSMKSNIVVSGMTASSIRSGDRVSRIDWAETKKLSIDSFPKGAKQITYNLFLQLKSVKK
jgi:hypothetical protein